MAKVSEYNCGRVHSQISHLHQRLLIHPDIGKETVRTQRYLRAAHSVSGAQICVHGNWESWIAPYPDNACKCNPLTPKLTLYECKSNNIRYPWSSPVPSKVDVAYRKLGHGTGSEVQSAVIWSMGNIGGDWCPEKEGHGFLRSISERISVHLLSTQQRINRTANTRR